MSSYFSALKDIITSIPRQLSPCLALGLVVLTASCAGTPPSTTASMTGEGEEAKECLLIKLTGTNIPKRRCYTKAEWEALSKVDREVASEYSRQTRENSSVVQYEQNASGF